MRDSIRIRPGVSLCHTMAIVDSAACIRMSRPTPASPVTCPCQPTRGSPQGRSMLRRRVRVKLLREKKSSARLRPDAVAVAAEGSGVVNRTSTVSAVDPVRPSRWLTTVASDLPSDSGSQVVTMIARG